MTEGDEDRAFAGLDVAAPDAFDLLFAKITLNELLRGRKPQLDAAALRLLMKFPP